MIRPGRQRPVSRSPSGSASVARSWADAPVDENFNLGEWEVDVGVAVARRAIASWTGVVGDADEPLPATPDNIEKLLRQIPGAFNEFQTRFGNLNRDYRVEGEASAVSPSGTLDEVQTPAEAA
jgi:hypothetical protein